MVRPGGDCTASERVGTIVFAADGAAGAGVASGVEAAEEWKDEEKDGGVD